MRRRGRALTRHVAAILVIAVAVFGTPPACYLATVAGSAWAYNNYGPGFGAVFAIVIPVMLVGGVAMGTTGLLRRI